VQEKAKLERKIEELRKRSRDKAEKERQRARLAGIGEARRE